MRVSRSGMAHVLLKTPEDPISTSPVAGLVTDGGPAQGIKQAHVSRRAVDVANPQS